MAAGVINRRNNNFYESDHNLSLSNEQFEKTERKHESESRNRRSLPGFGFCGIFPISKQSQSAKSDRKDLDETYMKPVSESSTKSATPKEKLHFFPTNSRQPDNSPMSARRQRYVEMLFKKKPDFSTPSTPVTSVRSAGNDITPVQATQQMDFLLKDNQSPRRKETNLNKETPDTVKQKHRISHVIPNHNIIINRQNKSKHNEDSIFPESASVTPTPENRSSDSTVIDPNFPTLGSVTIKKNNKQIAIGPAARNNVEVPLKKATLIHRGSKLIKNIKKRFSLPGQRSKTFSSEFNLYYPRSYSWAASSDVRISRQTKQNNDVNDDVITVASDSVLSSGFDWIRNDISSSSSSSTSSLDYSSELAEIVEQISAFNTATSSLRNEILYGCRANKQIVYGDGGLRRFVSRDQNQQKVCQCNKTPRKDLHRENRKQGSVTSQSSERSIDMNPSCMEDRSVEDQLQNDQQEPCEEPIIDETCSNSRLRRKKVIKIKRPRHEGGSYSSRTLPLARRCNSLHDDPAQSSAQSEGYRTLQPRVSKQNFDFAFSSSNVNDMNATSPAIVITQDFFNMGNEDSFNGNQYQRDSLRRRLSFPCGAKMSDICAENSDEEMAGNFLTSNGMQSLKISSRSEDRESILSSSAESESKRGSTKSVMFKLPLCSDDEEAYSKSCPTGGLIVGENSLSKIVSINKSYFNQSSTDDNLDAEDFCDININITDADCSPSGSQFHIDGVCDDNSMLRVDRTTQIRPLSDTELLIIEPLNITKGPSPLTTESDNSVDDALEKKIRKKKAAFATRGSKSVQNLYARGRNFIAAVNTEGRQKERQRRKSLDLSMPKGFSVAPSIQFVFDLFQSGEETESVTPSRDSVLADVLYEPVERRGLSLEQVEVLMEGSTTPIPLLSDCHLFTDSTLHVRVKEEEKKNVISLLPLSTSSHNRDRKLVNGLNLNNSTVKPSSGVMTNSSDSPVLHHMRASQRFRSSSQSIKLISSRTETHPLAYTSTISLDENNIATSESVKSKKSVSSAEEGGGGGSGYADISPYSTLRRRDPAGPGMPSSKQPSKLQSLFNNPFNKVQDKQEQLTDLLNQYSTMGLPKMPDLLTLGRPHYDPCSFQLEHHWSDIVSNHEKLNKRQRDQQEALWELLTTEVEYIRKLRVIIDIEADKLFSNVCDVYYATCHFWSSHMSQVLRHSRETRDPLNPCLLKAGFLVFDKIFEPYTKYCLEQEVCREYIKIKTKENDLFRTFITWAESHKQCGRLKLVDLIVMPWQRLTKYKLLLYAIRKPLEKMDPSPYVEESYEDMNLMINQVEKFVHEVNIAMRQRHQCKQLSLMIDRIESYDVVDAPNDECVKLVNDFCKLDLNCPVPGCGQQEMRILLLEGNLKLKDTYTKMDVYCFLFTDMLLITKPAARRGDKVKVIKPPMRLDKIVAHSLRDLTSFMLLYLNEYHMAQAVYTFHGDSKLWLDNVTKAQVEYKEKRHAYLTRNDALIMDLYDNTDELYPHYVDRPQSVEPSTELSRNDSCGSADTYLPNYTAEQDEAGRSHPSVKSQLSAPSSFGLDPYQKPPMHRLASYRSELVTNVDDYKHSSGLSRRESMRKEEGNIEGEGEGGKGRRNQRRLDRNERRYHTADTVQDMNRRRRHEPGLHKRLSWNNNNTDVRHRGDSMKSGALSQSESLHSVPSSSGVGSSVSLYHRDDDIDEEEQSDEQDTTPRIESSIKCDAETQTPGEVTQQISRWIPLGDIRVMRPHSASLPNFVEVLNGHTNGHRVTTTIPYTRGRCGGAVESVEVGNDLSSPWLTQQSLLSASHRFDFNRDLMMRNATMEASEV